MERIQAHERGDQTPELCYPGEKDGHFQKEEIEGTELVLWTPEMLDKAYPKSILDIWNERENELED